MGTKIAWVSIWNPVLHGCSHWICTNILAALLTRDSHDLDYFKEVLPRLGRMLSLVFTLSMSVFVYSSPTLEIFVVQMGLTTVSEGVLLVVKTTGEGRKHPTSVSSKQRAIVAGNDIVTHATVQFLAWVTTQMLHLPQLSDVRQPERVVRLIIMFFSMLTRVGLYFLLNHHYKMGITSKALHMRPFVDPEFTRLCVAMALMVTTLASAIDPDFRQENS
jgi:hypothetical protein